MSIDESVARMIAAVRDADDAAVRRLVANDPALLACHDPDCFGSTPLIHAVLCDNRDMVDLLLDAGADVDQRSDWWAGSFGVLDNAGDKLAEYLLRRGATLTPHAAARLGKADALHAMLDADPSVVHARGGDGQFPLHFARTPAIADMLLNRGADIDGRDIDHESTAAQWMGGRVDVATHLVGRGCAVEPFLAARIGDLDRLAETVGAEPDGLTVTVTTDRFPTTAPAAMHIYIYNLGEHCTLLHAAASGDQPRAVAWLAGQGADLDARGGYDDATPLHQAAWAGSAGAVAALLDAGADIDARSGPIHENEPVGWAIVSGTSDVVRVLLDRGCRVRDIHREDAAAGAQGEFRQFNRNRPMQAWREIAALMKA